ncbi:MAG: response regulator, partial [Chitinophagaceae bacterium]|nr:response regulator [Chitinophagaceae bacterium]
IYNEQKITLEEFALVIIDLAHPQLEKFTIEATYKDEYFSFLCYPLKEDKVVHVYGHNITQQKLTSKQLTSTALRFSNLITNLHEGILLEDENRRIVVTNQLFCNLFNIPVAPDFLVGADCSNSAEQSQHLFKDPIAFIKNIEQITQAKELVVSEVIEMADGRFVERDYIPIFINEVYQGHLWKYRDITERKLAEANLKIQEEKYRRIIANMNLGLVEVDLNDKIQYVNQSFTELSGYNIDELLGNNASEIFLTEADRNLMHKKNQSRKKGISDAYEVQVKNKKGDLRWWLISGAPLFNDLHQQTGSIGIHLDITAQKELEEELIEAKRLAENSSHAKEIFLTNMSHEIRTPMNAIIGMKRQLQKTTLNTNQQLYLNVIGSAADNLLVIINDILDFSKIEAGKIVLEKIGFNLVSLVQQSVQILKHKAEEKGIRLTVNIDESVANVFIGDPFRINQVLMNLLSNAIKFTEKGYVEVSCKVLLQKGTKQQLEICVKDTGIGMDEKFLAVVFQKFSQEDESIARRYGGTGLGMSISKQLVELMGGSIRVQSKKNVGSSIGIKITLPIGNTNDLPLHNNLKADSSVLRGKKILVVEDNEMNRFVALTLLEQYGATVDQAMDGKEAVNFVENHYTDLILMDVRMPVMDGIEATKQIRANQHTSIPIIALTANAVKGEQEKCLAAGMNDYLTKPFEEENLISTIATWLGKQIQFSNDTITKEAVIEDLYSLDKLNLIGGGNPAFIAKMLSLFEREATNAIVEIKKATQLKDVKQINATAHRIKPSIDNLAIKLLQEDVRILETFNPNESTWSSVELLMEKFERIIHQVVDSMKTKKQV